MCLLCNRVFLNESMKPSRLKEYLAKIHPDKAGKDFNYFKSLREKFEKRPTLSNMFSTRTGLEMDGLRASFNISLMIARSGKAHTNGEELLQPVLDESSLPGNEAILLAYVRFIKEEDLAQEFLFARELVMDSKGKSMFQVVEEGRPKRIGHSVRNSPSALGGEVLKRDPSSFPSARHYGVLEFFEKEDASLCANLKKFEGDIAYMADLYTKFNEMNLQLQGDDLNLIKTKSVISAFVSKLLYFKNNLARGEFYNFPNLCELRRKGRINEQNVEVYWRHLELLHQDFIERFEDILSLEVPDWITDPFSGVENAELQLQEELLELQANEELKPKFDLGYRAFWLQRVIPHLYPGLWNVVRKLLISFPSSYLAERGFSVVADLLTKKRNKLQIVNRGDLRLRLTSIEPDIEKLLSLRGYQA
ncbi:hypothetical protein M514_23636 [Trichuris suis]|uniref:HAT C-terminal dimerisation domain-containing protein n=1 Tax=Trichuris suis TaxID=68888 RepID=A0A085N3V1_9BILA|nr:hypothetical protein M514_23636 [Trichuris suis]